MKTIIGIDPGMKGGIAIITPHPFWDVRVGIMPMMGKDLDYQLIRLQLKEANAELAVIEKVHSMPKQGVASSFRFGRVFEGMIAACAMLDIPIIQVTPQAWKKKVLAGLAWKGNKDASIEYVRRRFPELNLLRTPKCRKYHDGMADAICIGLSAIV